MTNINYLTTSIKEHIYRDVIEIFAVFDKTPNFQGMMAQKLQSSYSLLQASLHSNVLQIALRILGWQIHFPNQRY